MTRRPSHLKKIRPIRDFRYIPLHSLMAVGLSAPSQPPFSMFPHLPCGFPLPRQGIDNGINHQNRVAPPPPPSFLLRLPRDSRGCPLPRLAPPPPVPMHYGDPPPQHHQRLMQRVEKPTEKEQAPRLRTCFPPRGRQPPAIEAASKNPPPPNRLMMTYSPSPPSYSLARYSEPISPTDYDVLCGRGVGKNSHRE